MKLPNPLHDSAQRTPLMNRGLTLLEVTVVILVLLSLIAILFVGVQGWKRGSDRALCIINIRNVQTGVRGLANVSGVDPGQNFPNLQGQLFGTGNFLETSPACPALGNYTYGVDSGVNTVPLVGELYLSCDLAGPEGHIPIDFNDW